VVKNFLNVVHVSDCVEAVEKKVGVCCGLTPWKQFETYEILNFE
jgi:hypothetical protein